VIDWAYKGNAAAGEDIRMLTDQRRSITKQRRRVQRAGITETVGTLVADGGYLSEDNLNAEGPDCLIATGKSHAITKQAITEKPLPPEATPTERNDLRLQTADGRAVYSKRQQMIEPVFGHTKANRGYRSFMRRGMERCARSGC
jgi:hypothetical protein